MRPFDRLTRRGRARRLLPLAADVLATDYHLDGVGVRPLAAHSFNTMFRVDGRGDVHERFVLRVGDELRIHVAELEDVEAAWLADLDVTAPAIAGPRNVADLHGRTWTTASRPGIPGERVCALFTWVRGRRLSASLDERGMLASGRLLAGLHDHATAFAAPVGIPTGIVANRVIHFEDRTRILQFRSGFGDLFVEAIARVQERLDALWASPPHHPHLLHGDFQPHNVMRWRDELRPIDFQDLRFGFDVQDLGITLADLGEWKPETVESFRRGYAQVRPWPELPTDLEAALAAARSLDLINLGLNLRRPGIEQFLAGHTDRILAWMGSGG